MTRNPIVRYTLPFVALLILNSIQGSITGSALFIFYGIKTLLLLGIIIFCFSGFKQEIEGGFDWKAIGLGVLVFAIWIAPEIIFPQERPVTFNPDLIQSQTWKWAALLTRLLGACITIPIIEEIFFRSFLMRYLIKSDFLAIKPGTFTHFSFWGTAALFGLMHARWQWEVAIITGILYGFYLVKTRNLRGCIWAHAATNLFLGIYVISTGQWKFW